MLGLSDNQRCSPLNPLPENKKSEKLFFLPINSAVIHTTEESHAHREHSVYACVSFFCVVWITALSIGKYAIPTSPIFNNRIIFVKYYNVKDVEARQGMLKTALSPCRPNAV